MLAIWYPKRESQRFSGLSLVFFSLIVLANWANAEISVKTSQKGDWSIAESSNFSVWMQGSTAEAIATVHSCERLKSQLQKDWCADSDEGLQPWLQPCVVVVHRSQGEYAAAVKSASPRSAGCTTTTLNGGRVIFRRIDLRVDSMAWRENALPHEITHVILADLFPSHRLPEWLNEGLATLAESEQLRARRQSVLTSAWRSGQLPPLHRLVADDSSSSTDLDVLYACRASLLRFLQQNGESTSLSEFTKVAVGSGCEQALREIYHFERGLPELEERWHQSLRTELGAQSTTKPMRTAGIPMSR